MGSVHLPGNLKAAASERAGQTVGRRDLAKLKFVDHKTSKIAERADLIGGQLAGPRVDGTQRANIMAVMGFATEPQRRSEYEVLRPPADRP
jgi:hypothetical protein